MYFDNIKKEPLWQLFEKEGLEGAAKSLNLPPEDVRNKLVILAYLYDSESFAVDRLKIIDKNGSLVPLVYNNGQKKIRDAKERQLKSGKSVRIALLKARQFGGSTLEEGDVFKECVLRAGRSCMIIAHDLDSARHLREMSARFYENYNLDKPRLKKETDKWWKFLHRMDGKSLDSNLRIDTAEELSTGHSLTLHHLHLSEVQNWRNAPILVKGLFPTVPNSVDTTIFMEGTGSGVGDYWYDFCQMAQSEGSEWEFVFVPWFEIEDYTLKFDTLEQKGDFDASLDGEENLLRHSGITLEQLHWRRVTIKNQYKGDIDAFRQQYPASADEAFLTSGRPVFDALKVKEGLQKSKPPIKTGYLRKKGSEIEFDENEKGYWEIWEEPENKENLYCLGADVAEGISVVPELGNRGGDYSVAKILRRDNRRMVACCRVRIDADLFADELAKAGRYWKCGLLVENNPGGSGNVVIRDLKETFGVNLLKTVTLDKIHDQRKEQYGWDTNKESKREMIDELTELIRDNRFIDYSKNFWYEASTYVRDEKGRTNAQSRKFDDEVIANALCFQADKLMPMLFKEVKKEEAFVIKPFPEEANMKQKQGNKVTQSAVMEQTYCEAI